MAGLPIYLALAFVAFSVESLDVVKYEAFESATAAKAFVNKLDKGATASATTCAARCSIRNKNWPEEQCNAFAWDGDTLACEIGSYDTEYVAEAVDAPVDKDLFVSAASGIGMDYLLYIGGKLGTTPKESIHVQMEDGVRCTGHHVPDLPQPRTSAAAVVYSQTKIYVAGGEVGSAGDPTKTVIMLDLKEAPPRTWKTKAPMASAKFKCGLAAHEGSIFAIGGKSDDTIEEYDTTTDSWTVLTGAVLPVVPPSESIIAKIDENTVWIADVAGKTFHQFDMDTRTVRTDLVLPVCSIQPRRVATVDVGGKRLVLAIYPFVSKNLYRIDPENLAAGCTEVLDSFPSLTPSEAISFTGVHRARTAVVADLTGTNPKWWLYDHLTGTFADKGEVSGLPKLTWASNTFVAAPAVHFPECRPVT